MQGYLSVPVYRGDKAITFAENQGFLDVAEFMKRRSSFVVVFGYDDDKSDWADINNAKMPEELKARAILEHFL